MRLWLLMPDHIHAIMSFAPWVSMSQSITDWKSYTARTLGINWQQGFFDDRLRSDRETEDKECYVVLNPVRAALCDYPSEWKFRWSSFDFEVNR